MSARNPVVRLFSWLWRGVDAVRKLLHLFLLVLIFSLIIGLASGTSSVTPVNKALYVQPYGMLVEQLEGDPYDRAIAELLGDGLPQTRIGDIVDALAYARDDDRIEVVYLDLNSFGGGGLPKLQTVADAIRDFQTSGKKVIASADFMGQQAYFLAAHADEVYLHPDGGVLLQGYGRYEQYYKDGIDKLRIDWNVFRVGTHKSFVEPYTRSGMSDEVRESVGRLVGQIWDMYQVATESARGLPEGVIADFAENLVAHVAATDGDAAQAALNLGLVDRLMSHIELQEYMIDLVGEGPDKEDTFESTEMRDYLAQMRLLADDGKQDENVAIVMASGEIMFGEQGPGSIGAESTARLLRRARKDDSVHAVVLRVDSPGGSAFAAEVIANEVLALRAAGKPVVASMGGTAASGGYSISMHADRVLANPATVTGSIGVFGMFPTYHRTLEWAGINTDGVGTTPWSGQFRPDREMGEQTKELLQLFVEDTYDDFVSDVALSRGMQKPVVDRIAQGQIWTGAEAVENGLVDALGSLEDAIQVAGNLAGLDDGEFGTVTIEPELSPSEQMVVDLLGTASSMGADLSNWVGKPDLLSKLVSQIDDTAAALLRFDDPKGMYMHCFCDLH